MPTHFIFADQEPLPDRSHVFCAEPGTAYRIRNALLAAGAIDPDLEPLGRLIHFRELFDDRHPLLVEPANITATVEEWRRRIRGVRIHEARGLSDREQSAATARFPKAPSTVVEIRLPDVDAEKLADEWIGWAERSIAHGGFIVVP